MVLLSPYSPYSVHLHPYDETEVTIPGQKIDSDNIRTFDGEAEPSNYDVDALKKDATIGPNVLGVVDSRHHGFYYYGIGSGRSYYRKASGH
jgi:hypothetical protein